MLRIVTKPGSRPLLRSTTSKRVSVEGETLTLTPAWIATVAWVSFEGSACGVTATVTMFGFGVETGAVYVATACMLFPPVACVVTTLNVPQLAPLQPAPLKDHTSTSLGADPGTGVSVATIVADPPAGTFDGAEICSENVLVTDTADEICFEGSATLCAVSVTLGGDGRIGGAG
jgi:hypothetical protein